MSIGIDKLGFYTPKNYIDIVELAEARDVEPGKFTIGIGQDKQAVPNPYEDVVTMAAEAANQILTEDNKKDIELVIVGTESSIDESKSSSAFLMDLLDLPNEVRAFEIKQACYGATAGLQMAKDFIATHPGKKALVIASDIAKYGIKTAGEVTQGAGAIAMLVSDNPQIVELEDRSVYLTKNVGDFWRPTFSKTAFARGKYSNEIYMDFFKTLFDNYNQKFDQDVENIDTLLFHIPYTKMGRKALNTIESDVSEEKFNDLVERYQKSIEISRSVGNLYTGSLYLGLLSYLINGDVKDNESLMMFSYGSGAVGEIYSAKVVPGFEKAIDIEGIKNMLDSRKKISISEYETIFNTEYKNDDVVNIDTVEGEFYLSEITENERLYSRISK
ncbi:hydroxymethylglutaryl-CoA synthase [Companilactobacillus metriopterae]|uniref:hydroxymethylglutaryl-CoA synthase n=1 Tax=Companilactobacillus metriopterae TaxID=1909267 RepID=UPI00100B954C|nr:hydroxymethylglutaryl-CoA synthase [Companilactobacillus metriopterae]